MFCDLRYSRIAAVLFLPESVLLHKEVEALRLLPHVVEGHTLRYGPCRHLGDQTQRGRIKIHFQQIMKKGSMDLCGDRRTGQGAEVRRSPCVSV